MGIPAEPVRDAENGNLLEIGTGKYPLIGASAKRGRGKVRSRRGIPGKEKIC